MNYELRSGERGSFSLGGPIAGPLKVAIGLVLGVGSSALIWFVIGKEVEYFEPYNDHYNFAVVVSAVVALLPPLYIWHGVGKECVCLTIRNVDRKVNITWRGLFSNRVETLGVDQVDYFDIRAEGGRYPVWILVLRRKGGDRMSLYVGKFRKSEDADRECEEANSFLRRAKR